jgi:hypothetical protein
MKKYTIDELKTKFAEKGYNWYPFMVVGIRSFENKQNVFDDLIGIVEGDDVTWYTATTNPGTHWLKNLMNPKGSAILKPGQWIDSWKIGLHKGKYEALVQIKAITVYRDKNKNAIAEETAITDTGLFGINIHRAIPKGITKFIDEWSAGCQVLNNFDEFEEFMEKCRNSGQKTFTYTLLKEFGNN